MFWIRRLHTFKISVFSRLIHRVDKIKILTDFLVEVDKLILKYIEKFIGYRKAREIFKQKNILENSHYQISRLTIKVTVIKMAWSWRKKRKIHQRNITESPEVNTHINGLDFQQRPRQINEERKSLLTNGAGITGQRCWNKN